MGKGFPRRFKCKTAMLVLLAIVALACSQPAYARTAFIDKRNDMDIAEEVSAALTGELAAFKKYVLTSLKDLKAIQELQKLFAEINKLSEEISQLTEYADMMQSMNPNDLLGDLRGIGEETIGELRGLIGGTMGDMVDFSGMQTGKTKSGCVLAGEDGDLSDIREDDGDLAYITTALSRGDQLIEQMAGSLSEAAAQNSESKPDISVNGGGANAAADGLMSAYKEIYSSAPFLTYEYNELYTRMAWDGDKTPQEAEAFFALTTGAMRTTPAASIIAILDKYMDEDSPNTMEKVSEKFIEEKKAEDDKNKVKEKSYPAEIFKNMAVLIRQRNAINKQMFGIMEINADCIKMDGHTAALHSAYASRSIMSNIAAYAESYSRVSKELQDSGKGGKTSTGE